MTDSSTLRKRTITLKELPSLIIDRDFINKLGQILEKTSHNPVRYTIQTSTETWEFNSVIDLINSNLASYDIQSFSARSSAKQETDEVSVSTRFSKTSYLSGTEFVSSNEPLLLKVKEDILALYTAHKSPWSFLYFDLHGGPILWDFILLIATFVFYKLFTLTDGKLLLTTHWWPYFFFFVCVFVLCWHFTHKLLTKAFPRITFSFSNTSNIWILRTTLITIVLGLLVNFLYDLLKK